ncbi:MAG: L-threonylcarbamoyladenylate synthase [Pseudomonadales bacterium]
MAGISPFRVQRAVETLQAGGLLAYPTEAVWGLGCDPDNSQALARLLQLKRRSPDKGLILVAANKEQLAPWLGDLSVDEWQRLGSRQAHPTSWIAPCNPNVDPLLSGGRPTLCVRVSAHPLVEQLCTAWSGPIVSTSANPSGRQPARSVAQARGYFANAVDYYLAGNLGGATSVSEIRYIDSGETVRASRT